MIKAIPMEDWLRGCVYHDGRHGEVMLPTDKVLQIANYIQRTRRSGMDGLIDLEVVRKDEPQADCFLCKWLGDVDVCGRCRNRNLFAEANTEPNLSEIPSGSTISKMEQVEDEPQTERSENE